MMWDANVNFLSYAGRMPILKVFCVFSFLHDVEQLKFPKKLKEEHGGGLLEFVISERQLFVGNEDEDTFIMTQEKQAIILHRLNSLYAVAGDELDHIKFVEGQAISEFTSRLT